MDGMKRLAGMRSGRRGFGLAGMALLAGFALSATGCGAFFVCQGKASCPTTATVVNSGDYAYVSNSTLGSNYLAEYTVSSGTLTAISGSPVNLGFTPVAMVVSPNNSFLYVESTLTTTSSGIYVYSIGTTGALTVANGGTALVSDPTVVSMDISPDGNFLYTVGLGALGGAVLNQYTLNTTTGLTSAGVTSVAFPNSTCTLGGASGGAPASPLCAVRVSPGGTFVGVALGPAGSAVLPYSSTAGLTSLAPVTIASPSATSGDYSLAFDANNYLYIARTLQLASYSSVGTTPVAGTVQTYAGGAIPRAVTLSRNSSYVYTADEGTGGISGFSLSGAGVTTAVATTAFNGPTNVSALGVDNSGKYLLAAGYNAGTGVQLLNIGTGGVLTATGSTQGTSATLTTLTLVAMTH